MEKIRTAIGLMSGTSMDGIDVALHANIELPEEAALYEEWHRRRLEVKPGLTGLWQVLGRSDTSFDDMVRLDIYYAENWSPGMDLRIMLETIPAVLSGKGAY